jgi:uncharacterized repeat protein (TIGR03847 family)
MSRSFEMDQVEWVTVGTVGEPGRREFYLQARQEGELVTLKLEKEHVAAMSQVLGQILTELAVPNEVPDDYSLTLAEPLEAEWAVSSLQVAYDSDSKRILIVAEESPSEEADEVAIARLALSTNQAAAIVRHGAELVRAGRPRCGLCGHPIDPEGHSCPKTNGRRAPAP